MLEVEVPASIPLGQCEIHVSNGAEKSDIVSVTIK